MKEILKNKNLKICLDYPNKIMIISWLKGNIKNLEKNFVPLNVKCGKSIEKFIPKKILFDFSNIDILIVPDIQEKLNEIYRTAFEFAGIEKVAVTNNPDEIVNMSIRQTFDEKKEIQKFETVFFQSVQLAIDWLLQEKSVYFPVEENEFERVKDFL